MDYKTNGNLNYNGTLYKPGSKVNIADKELAEQLLQANIIRYYEDEAPPETEKKSTRKKSILSDLVETPQPTEETQETQETLGV